MTEKKKTTFDLHSLRPAVMLVPVCLFAVLVVAGTLDGEKFIAALNDFFTVLMVNASWLVALGVLAFVAFMIFLIVHPVGSIKLGGPDAKPEYGLWTWFTISLCAGIGTGIAFWGPVEPLMFTVAPQESAGVIANSSKALIWAFEKSYLHWSFAPYACYCVFGAVIAFAVYNLKGSFSVSAGFMPVLGEKAEKKGFRGVIDTLTVFALIGGVAGSLGYGLLQISSGLNGIFGIPNEALTLVVICVVIMVMATLSSVSGMNRGIKWLSDKNAWLFLFLMILALVAGPTQWIFNLFAQTFGSFLNNFVTTITAVSPFPNDGSVAGVVWANNSELWPQWWDHYYFVDFLSFGPIVGLFSIKLAKGRTLREFVIMNWFVPAMFGIIWFAVFGGLSLDIQYNFAAYADKIDLQGCATLYDYLVEYGSQSLMLKVVEALPFSFIIKPGIILLIAVSFITLADSMTSTISLMSLKDNYNIDEAPSLVKIIWGVLIAAAALIFTLTGSIDGIKIVKTIAGFPILIVGIAMMVGFLVSLSTKGSALDVEMCEARRAELGLGAGEE